ncbi:MAG: SDR family oxidoreductase [Rhodobacteraceae bacterium]|nr:SDR family oxidoreductase [Paracoccaceae bacterium]
MHILITGAATGIGAATAKALRAKGARITAIDIVEPGKHADEWIEADLTDPEAIAGLTLPGPIDALVNSAGLPPRPGLEPKILALNFLGLRTLTEKALPGIAKGGAIVSISSKAGARWRENLDQVKRFMALEHPDQLPDFIVAEGIAPVRAYDLSKEAVIVWTKAQTARLQGMDLRANTVSPAAVETGILEDFVTAFGDRATKGVALMGRPGTADEVGQVAAFLASPESGWLKGQDIAVDGGLAARMECEALRF